MVEIPYLDTMLNFGLSDAQGLRMKIAGVFDGMEADVVRGISWQSGGLHVGEEFGGRILSVGRSSL